MNNGGILENIGVSMVMKPMSMLLSLIYMPLALAFLGEAKYEIWVIILNIVLWLSYFDIDRISILFCALIKILILGEATI